MLRQVTAIALALLCGCSLGVVGEGSPPADEPGDASAAPASDATVAFARTHDSGSVVLTLDAGASLHDGGATPRWDASGSTDAGSIDAANAQDSGPVQDAAVAGRDAGVRAGRDAGVDAGQVAAADAGRDAGMLPDAGATTDAGSGNGIGPRGGTVTRLHFGVSGDTRPAACEDVANYPTPVINGIATDLEQKGSQFVIDLGDHMYVCNNDLPNATAQMDLFMSATRRYRGTWFMTMGNHECWHSPCLVGSQNANYLAYTRALAPVSALPYYTFDVQTSFGKATFVIIADNGWDQAQATWLDRTLTQADTAATYTIVVRHHPPSDTSLTEGPAILAAIRAHKFALLLTGHDHKYEHPPRTDNGRVLVLGTGGAPLVAGGSFYGYAMVDQLSNGDLELSVYNSSTGLVQDTWTVGTNGP